jgi:L-asparagine oxygenase
MLSTVAQHRTPPSIMATGSWPTPVGTSGTIAEETVESAGRAVAELPHAVRTGLADFTRNPGPTGGLLLRGVPIGPLPATPPTPRAATGAEMHTPFTLLTVARALGEPVGYLPEQAGDIVQNIVPVQQSATRQVSTSSKVQLMFHTEAAFHPHRPRYLLLLCLRGDPSASTTLASIREVAPLIEPTLLDVLFQPRFRTAPDESYLKRPDAPRQLGAPMPVLSGNRHKPSMVFDAELMVGIDAEARQALNALSESVAAHHTGVVLEPGDLLVIDNHVAVHGRSPFTPRFDGTDRWLQRSFVVPELPADRIGRVITTTFD